MPVMKVKCPRCKRILTAHDGQPYRDCNCHLYCEDGTKPNDCTVSLESFSGQLGWPRHLRTGKSLQEGGDDEMHRVRYCSVHSKYIYKVPILVSCNWERWFSKRAPKRLRMSHGKI